jgi:acyl-CoA oxidase
MSSLLEANEAYATAGFAVEHLLGRLEAPRPLDANHILARHEKGIVTDLRASFAEAKGSHRSAALASLVLPECMRVIHAIGHRMAYEAAKGAHVDPLLVQLFVASMVKTDAVWYAENGLGSIEQARMEREAVNAALPRITEFIDALQADHCVSAPIVSDRSWAEHVSSLKVCGNDELDGGMIQEALQAMPVLARL